MNTGRQVVVVDGIRETEEVLKAVLEPRGWDVARRRSVQLTATEPPPRLVVLHDDADDGLPAPVSDCWSKVPRVVIGRMERVDDNLGRSVVSTPFQYGELLNAIDRLLDESPATATDRRPAA